MKKINRAEIRLYGDDGYLRVYEMDDFVGENFEVFGMGSFGRKVYTLTYDGSYVVHEYDPETEKRHEAARKAMRAYREMQELRPVDSHESCALCEPLDEA